MENFYITNHAIKGGRDYQEDYQRTLKIDDESYLLILADGMGGYKGGAKASQTVVHNFVSAFDKHNPNIKEALNNALNQANEALRLEKEKYPDLKNMGTTLIAVYININFIQWVSVGDSPLWLISKRYDTRLHKNYGIKRINKNHSIAGLLQLQFDHDEITREEMENSPNKHMLTSAITGDKLKSVDLSNPMKITKDDIIVLASDGVETLSKNELLNLVINNEDFETLATTILKEVTNKHSPDQDNSSILLITNRGEESEKVEEVEVENPILESSQKLSTLNTIDNFIEKNKNSIYALLIGIVGTLFVVFMLLLYIASPTKDTKPNPTKDNNLSSKPKETNKTTPNPPKDNNLPSKPKVITKKTASKPKETNNTTSNLAKDNNLSSKPKVITKKTTAKPKVTNKTTSNQTKDNNIPSKPKVITKKITSKPKEDTNSLKNIVKVEISITTKDKENQSLIKKPPLSDFNINESIKREENSK